MPFAPAVTSGGSTDPSVFDPSSAAYGAKMDGTFIQSVNTSGTALTATIGGSFTGFTSADVGKSFLIGNGATGGVTGTISAFGSATTVTLSVSAGTLTGAPMAYGTDDLPAWILAANAASAYAAAHGGATLRPPANKWTFWASPTTKGVGNQGNAQLPVPLVAGGATAVRYPMIYDFGGGAPINPMFSGVTTIPAQGLGGGIITNLTGLTVDGTFGAPSVIGGPTTTAGFGESNNAANWNLVMPVIKGLNLITPLNPTISGLDFRGCAAARVESFGMWPLDTIANIKNVGPTTQTQSGVLMPVELNNVEAWVGDVSVYGCFTGYGFWAHSTVQSAKAIYCVIGVFLGGDGNDKHGLTCQYLCVEAVQQAIQCDGNSGITIPVDIGMLDVEAIAFWSGGSFGGQSPFHISDPNSGLGGRIAVNDNSGDASVLKINGAANAEIISPHEARTVQGAPAYTLGTAFQNPWWRHSFITLNNGTTTGILIGPTSATCTTSVGTVTTSPVSFRLPSGWWFNIQGSVKPTTFNAVLD